MGKLSLRRLETSTSTRAFKESSKSQLECHACHSMYVLYIQVRSTDRAVRLLVSTDDVEACETRREDQGEESVRWSCGPLVSEVPRMCMYLQARSVVLYIQYFVHGLMVPPSSNTDTFIAVYICIFPFFLMRTVTVCVKNGMKDAMICTDIGEELRHYWSG